MFKKAVLIAAAVILMSAPVRGENPFRRIEMRPADTQEEKRNFYFCSYVIPHDSLWVSLLCSEYNDCYGNYGITAGSSAWWFGWLSNPDWAGGWAPYFAGWQYPKNLGGHEYGQIVSDHSIMFGYNKIVSDFLIESDIQSPIDSLAYYPGKYRGLTSFYGFYFASINREFIENYSQSDYLSFFDDVHSKKPLGILGWVRNLRWNYPSADAFQIRVVTLLNESEYDYNGFYIGLFMDPDVDRPNAASNISFYDADHGTCYTKHSSKEFGVVGMTFFEDEPLRSVKLDLTYEGWQEWNDEFFWNILSDTRLDEKNTFPHDALMIASFGPYDLPSGSTVEIAWADVMGYDVQRYLKNSDTARSVKANNWTLPNPPPNAPYLRGTAGNKSVYLKWSRNRNYIPKPRPGVFTGYYEEEEDPWPEYEYGSEASQDPPNSGIRDWDGYRVYRNLTGLGDIDLGDYALVLQCDSTYVYTKWGVIPESEMNPQTWTNTYFAEYTDTDPAIFNGFTYYYAVVAYDKGNRSATPVIDPAYSSALANVLPLTPKWVDASTPAEWKGQIEVVPNPYISGQYSTWESTDRKVDIIHLPDWCTINIYSYSGVKVRTIQHAEGDADHQWNLTNDQGQALSSGIYFIRVVPADGSPELTGKFMIIK